MKPSGHLVVGDGKGAVHKVGSCIASSLMSIVISDKGLLGQNDANYWS